MSVKFKFKTYDNNNSEFPKLMISDSGRIVYMTEEYTGLQIGYIHQHGYSGKYDSIGRFKNDWDTSSKFWEDYNKEIILSNK